MREIFHDDRAGIPRDASHCIVIQRVIDNLGAVGNEQMGNAGAYRGCLRRLIEGGHRLDEAFAEDVNRFNIRLLQRGVYAKQRRREPIPDFFVG